MYETDYGVYPPGDGRGSRELVKCLRRPGPKGFPYFEFQDDMLDADGNVINPVFPSKPSPQGIIHYRNNLMPGGVADPPVRFKKSFDIWADDGKGRPCGVNNWE